MRIDWEKASLGAVTTWLSGGTPNKSTAAFWNGDIPWISANSMYGTRFENSDLRITEAGLRSGSRLAPKNSVLLLVRGGALHNRLPVGIACRHVAFNQDVKALIANPERLDPWFLLYWLIGHERYLLDEVVEETGIGAGKLDTKRMQSLMLSMPPLKEQRHIASIARSIDDKIDLNRRINQTLEAMAQAIFKSWFVDFDPVKAKIAAIEQGQDPLRAAMRTISGLSACNAQAGKTDAELDQMPREHHNHLATTAALFPDEMQDSELGEIPKGWRVVSASTLIEFNPKEPLCKGTVAPYLDMASLPTSGSWAESPIPREFGCGMRFRNGDALLARITPCLENGKSAFIQNLPDESVGWGSTEFIVMRSKNPVPQEYAYLLVRHAAFREHAIRSMTGTSGRQRAQADAVSGFKIAAPSDDSVWRAFSELVSPSFKGIKAHSEAIETLAELRDTLLPQLLSGELSVAKIKDQVTP